MQIDRVPRGVRGRRVGLLGEVAQVPEGPLRLAMLTGAPILPVFSARLGYRRYEITAHRPIRLSRSESDAALRFRGVDAEGFRLGLPEVYCAACGRL